VGRPGDIGRPDLRRDGPWAVLNNILFTLIGLAMLVAIAIHLWRTARE
jgi:hypothetical protein